MRKTKIQNNRLWLYEYLIAAALVLNANSIYIYMSTSNIVTAILLFILFLGILLYVAGKKIHVRQWNKCLLLFAIWTIYAMFYILMRPVNLIGDIHLWLAVSFFIAYFSLVWGFGDKGILLKYQQCIYIIAIVSMLMWIFCSQAKLISTNTFVNSVWKGTDKIETIPNYFFVYFETQSIDVFGMSEVIRNSAIFTEAPMASLHFSIALMIELFMRKKPSVKRSIVFIAAIASTLSTTGIILVVICVGYEILFYRPKTVLARQLKFFVVILAVAALIVGCVMLLETKIVSNSGSIRLDDFTAGFKAWCENIFIGNGGGEANQLILEKYMSTFRLYNTGFSNSIMRVLSERGLYGGLVYVACFISAIICSIRERDRKKFIFTILFVYLFIVTVIPYLYLTLFILIYLVKSKQTSQVKYNVYKENSIVDSKKEKIISKERTF